MTKYCNSDFLIDVDDVVTLRPKRDARSAGIGTEKRVKGIDGRCDGRLYTKEEVHELVTRAVKEAETRIREEYDRVLQERLAGTLLASTFDASFSFSFG